MTFEQKLKSKIEKFKKQKCRNAFCLLNEVDSDLDYYNDLGKCEGIDETFNLLAPLLVDCENDIRTAIMYLESTGITGYEHFEPEHQMYISLKSLLNRLEQFTEE